MSRNFKFTKMPGPVLKRSQSVMNVDCYTIGNPYAFNKVKSVML